MISLRTMSIISVLILFSFITADFATTYVGITYFHCVETNPIGYPEGLLPYFAEMAIVFVFFAISDRIKTKDGRFIGFFFCTLISLAMLITPVSCVINNVSVLSSLM